MSRHWLRAAVVLALLLAVHFVVITVHAARVANLAVPTCDRGSVQSWLDPVTGQQHYHCE